MLLAISHAPRRIPTLTTLNLLCSSVSALQVYIFQGQIGLYICPSLFPDAYLFIFAFLSLPTLTSAALIDLYLTNAAFYI